MSTTGEITMNKPHRTMLATSVFLSLLVADCFNPHAADDNLLADYESRSYDNISYPGIEPPPDIEDASPVDERALWKLLSKKKYEELTKLIERYRLIYPGWQPPKDLLVAMIREEINTAIAANDWDKIIELSLSHPSAFSCDDIDHMWSLGNALHARGKMEDLETHYSYILENCANPEHRLITLQRASSQLPYETTARLIEVENNRPHNRYEKLSLDNFRYEFFTGWLADAWQRGEMQQIEQLVSQIDKQIIERKDAKIASLLGWWEMRRKNPGVAKTWFSQALGWQPDPDTAYGLALALRDANEPDQARVLARNWRDQEPRMASLISARGVSRPAAPRPGPSEIALSQAAGRYKQGDYQRSLAISRNALGKPDPKRKEKTERALRMIEAWSLYHQFESEQAASRFETLYRSKADIDSAKGLVFSSIENKQYEHVLKVGGADCGPLNFFLSSRPPADQPETTELYYLFYKSWIGEHLKAKDFQSVLYKFKKITDKVVEKRDADMAAAAGWAYLNKGDYGNALFWFERAMAWSPNVDSAYGLAQAKRKLGDIESAEALARKWQGESSKMRILHSESLLDSARRKYEQKDYRASLADAQASAAIKPTIEAEKLIAWNRYQLGEYQQAAEDFERIYRNHPDKEGADGLAASLQALKDEQRLEAIAQETGGPLNDHVADMHAIRQFYKDQFVLAEQTRVNALPELKNIDTASFSIMPYARHRSGDDGLGHLDMTGVELEGQAFFGLHHFTATLDLINLDSGTPAGNALLGSNVNGLFNTFNTTPTKDTSMLIEPMLTYRYEGKVSPYVAIGTTPIGGEVGAAVVGKIGVDVKTEKGKYTAEVFAENKQESILSTSGIVDPVTGNSWGRVVEKGVRGNVTHKLNESWTVTAGGQLATLDGHNVADNDHFAFWTSLGYNIPVEGFKYLTVGPAYRFDHYSDNRSFFTYGHGGYFSPDTFHRIGGEVNFQTDEGKQFVVKGRASLGYQRTSEDDAFALPLSSSGPVLKGGDDSGLAFDTQVSGVYRLNHWLQVGAFVNVTQSPDFDDYGGGVFLRVNAFDRPAVFSSDLKYKPWND